MACARPIPVRGPSERAESVAVQFGVDCSPRKVVIAGGARIELAPGRLVLVTGPSGSGKSSVLAQIERAVHGCVVVGRREFPAERAVVDCIAPWGTIGEAVSFLTACGLGEPRLWLRPYIALSDGECFRARLAQALALNGRGNLPFAMHDRPGNPVGPLLCDEFCSGLHRRLSRTVAFNLRKVVSRSGLCAVLATVDDSMATDLQPDAIVRLGESGACQVEVRRVPRYQCSRHHRNLTIEQGRKRDYDEFAAMHYRAADELGFVDKVFVLREVRRGRRSVFAKHESASTGEKLGIVVYSYAPLELSLRKQATSRWFSRNPQRVNESLCILRRLVIHPDVRGCGLGHYLVRRTLPMVGTEFVECLAGMGEFNPVFEKAGMKRVGQYELSRERRAALAALRRMGISVNSREFVLHVFRNRLVREIVSRTVYRWYAGTTGGGERRVVRQSPEFLAQTFRGLIGSRPVYYLWQRRKKKAA